MLDLSIVIVNWNVRELVRRCLASIYPAAGNLAVEVIVVDNASTDGSVDVIRTEFPGVQLIANADNVGFTVGNNQGLRHSRGRYALLLNPDTEMIGAALATMVAYMDAHLDVGALGPQLLWPDGRVQSSRRRFPTMATAFLESTVLQQWFPRNPVLTRYYVLDRADDQTQDVDWVTGACLLTRREAVEQVGLLDESFFMYSEEADWCYRCRQAGWRVVYLPTAQVIHHEGQSSGQVVPLRHIRFHSSKVRFFRKHFGRWRAETVRWFLLGTYVYQLMEEGFKWLVGHKRPLRRERVAAYWQVLRSGLR